MKREEIISVIALAMLLVFSIGAFLVNEIGSCWGILFMTIAVIVACICVGAVDAEYSD